MDGRNDGRPFAAHLAEQQGGASADYLGSIHVVVDDLGFHLGEHLG